MPIYLNMQGYKDLFMLVTIYKEESMVWKEEGETRIIVVQMDNLSSY